MHDTHTQTGKRCSKANINYSNLKLTANQINNTAYSDNKTYTHSKEMDNNKNRQNEDRFTDGRLKYHWGADDEIMRTINRRDISPETKELFERRIKLTKPGHMRHQWHKKLEREILLPRRPDDVDRKEIKRIDIRLRKKRRKLRITHRWRLLQKLRGRKSSNTRHIGRKQPGNYQHPESRTRHRIHGFLITRRTGNNRRTGIIHSNPRAKIPRRPD